MAPEDDDVWSTGDQGKGHVQMEETVPLPQQVVYFHLLDTIDPASLPSPPASAAEWRERAMRMCEDMLPGLREGLTCVPIGWFSVIERAVQELRARLPPGAAFYTSQMKEKMGTLRWYGHIDDPVDEPGRDTGAAGATDWAETVSERVCAVYGTADGELDTSEFWLLTLSPAARELRATPSAGPHPSGLSSLMYPRWVDS